MYHEFRLFLGFSAYDTLFELRFLLVNIVDLYMFF
jgi:hypothetical protein